MAVDDFVVGVGLRLKIFFALSVQLSTQTTHPIINRLCDLLKEYSIGVNTTPRVVEDVKIEPTTSRHSNPSKRA